MSPAYSTEPLSRGLMATAGTWGHVQKQGRMFSFPWGSWGAPHGIYSYCSQGPGVSH